MRTRFSRFHFSIPLGLSGFLLLLTISICVLQGAYTNWQIRSHGIAATATVTAFRDPPGRGMPTIKYRYVVPDPNGNSQEYVGGGTIPGPVEGSFAIGTQIRVRYDPSDPTRSIIEDIPFPDYSFVFAIPVFIMTLLGIVAFTTVGIRYVLKLGRKK